MSDKKRSIIFEVPKASISPSVQALMIKAEEQMKTAEAAVGDLLGEPLEIDFLVQNDSVRYSMPGSKLAGPALAKSIVRAIQAYEVIPTKMKGKTRPSALVGESAVNYNRCVRIDWKTKQIFTNFKPHEGDAFLGAMAIVVEELQGGGGAKAAEEPTS